MFFLVNLTELQNKYICEFQKNNNQSLPSFIIIKDSTGKSIECQLNYIKVCEYGSSPLSKKVLSILIKNPFPYDSPDPECAKLLWKVWFFEHKTEIEEISKNYVIFEHKKSNKAFLKKLKFVKKWQ